MSRLKLCFCLLWVMILVSAGAGWAATINVPADHLTIQAAIDAASDSDVIVVAQGTYTENVNFKGKAITLRSTDPTNPTVVAATIIDGDGKDCVVKIDSGEGATGTMLAGLTLINGNCERGGGVFCAVSSPTIANNIIRDNTAGFGGGIEVMSGSPTIINNVITGNIGTYKGGGLEVWNTSGTVTIANNLISGNTSEQGGGLYCLVATVTNTNNTISNNSASIEGGGVYSVSVTETIKNTIIAFNVSGGGYVGGNSAAFSYCDVYGNTGGDFIGLSDPTGNNGNISVDPLFADAANGDFRLKSTGGRWTGLAWFLDAVTSPCVDTGDPASAFDTEPPYNGRRINMGFDGNTIYASKTNRAPSAPTSLVIAPTIPLCTDALTATASGSNDPDGGNPSYKYQWAQRTGLDTWGDWGHDSTDGTLTGVSLHKAEVWRVQACATDGSLDSTWCAPVEVTIGNARPTKPVAVRVTPASPGRQPLRAVAIDATDPDRDRVTYNYQWSRHNGTDWEPWSYRAQVLPAERLQCGETWRVRARAFDGTDYGAWKTGGSVTIASLLAASSPAKGAEGVTLQPSIYVNFRWLVQQDTVESRFFLKRGGTVIPGTLDWVTPQRKARFRPDSPLAPGVVYKVYLEPGIVATTGRVLDWGESFWFRTTGTAPTATVVNVATAPTAAGAQVTVNLSSAATVRTVITNIAGRVVAELPERELPAGVSALVWNGRSNAGTKVPAGRYLVRVQAKGDEGAQATGLAALCMR